VSKLDLCLERPRADVFAEHVWTDSLTIPRVTERIAASAGLTLAPNTDSPMRRMWTGLEHIRF
jgi:hypothetical protein